MEMRITKQIAKSAELSKRLDQMTPEQKAAVEQAVRDGNAFLNLIIKRNA